MSVTRTLTTRQRLLLALRTPLGLLTAVSFLALLALAIAAPPLWGAAASHSDPIQISQGPSAQHIFGTDAGGRDILLRTLVATRLSVSMALAATAIGVTAGIFLGCLPTLLRPRLGRLVVSLINIAVAFPALLLAIGLSVILGQSAIGAVLAIGFAMVPNYARLTYTLSASVSGRDFIAAAKVLGVSRPSIMLRHILPNIRDPLIVNASISAGVCLVSFAGLSFLGLGVQVPGYDWGRMLSEGVDRIFVSPTSALVPGIAIIVSGLIFTLLGEVLAKSLTGASSRSVLGRSRRGGRRLGDAGDGGGQSGSVAGGTAGGGDVGGVSTDGLGAAAEAEQAVLRVRNLRVAAPEKGAWHYPVKGISFHVDRGEIVGLVGESGSGKSLSVMSVAGLVEEPLEVTADQIRFDGTELVRNGKLRIPAKNRKLARQLGTRLAMVFQDPMSSLNPALKVGSQVAEIGVLHEDLSRKSAMQRAQDRLAAVRIPDSERRAGQYPHEFSGGMRQRAMIAMGLMGNPALVIADEPTTALDVTVQKEVLRLLKVIRDDNDTAVLLISHDIAVVTALCSRVLVMYRGRIVETILVADLVAGKARHPYTQALLASVPAMDSDRSRPLMTIPEGQSFGDDSSPDAISGETSPPSSDAPSAADGNSAADGTSPSATTSERVVS
ncbi:dipeptide/oligopeptide/nickel ABC transporter permease/ATP-binding protein [Saxibacter everestensis]|uniref:Dipeptide/oligopeptide/nickel ABC transporter permease/ATP-binding protein n=1 Tax=Saxibacter everestensis TaxID=2909229 RepID=A0ABY8QT46_9MICO|nr:dipeptide/oligopeptide/nickel ABC transporter permease/ATP-binding protein [Brevibacteriaceae bacterium ZFBP1038]